MRYQQYIDGKLSSRMPVGIQADLSGYDLNPHQKALAEWALRRGKAAIFAARAAVSLTASAIA